jgi:hypothetical protein
MFSDNQMCVRATGMTPHVAALESDLFLDENSSSMKKILLIGLGLRP